MSFRHMHVSLCVVICRNVSKSNFATDGAPHCYRKLPEVVLVACSTIFDGAVTMDGHVLRTELCCINGHRIKWASSSILGSKYTANCR